MTKFCIAPGSFKKILLFPFLYSLANIIKTIYQMFYPEKQQNLIIDGFSNSFGIIAVKIIPHLKCFSLSNQKEKTKCQCQCTCKNFSHYLILFIIITFELVATLFSTVQINGNKKIQFQISEIISTKDAIVIILITIMDKLLLKYEYFIHHIISIIIFVAISVSIDLILQNYSILSKVHLIIILGSCLSILTRVAYLCYIKYMIDKQYHYYWNIILFHGILMLSIVSLAFIAILLNVKKETTIQFYDYFDKVPVGIIIGKFILNFIFEFISNLLEILTIFYLSPEFILISNSLVKFLGFFIGTYKNYKIYICILFFILQFFSLMIYLEILELDFLNLNKNTKRNIKKRIDDDSIDRKGSIDTDNFEVGDGYIFDGQDNFEKENQIEEDDYSAELGQLKYKKENDKDFKEEK